MYHSTEQKIKFNVVISGRNIKSAILSGHFEMDEDSSVEIYGAPVGAMIGNMFQHSGCDCAKIEIWRD